MYGLSLPWILSICFFKWGSWENATAEFEHSFMGHLKGFSPKSGKNFVILFDICVSKILFLPVCFLMWSFRTLLWAKAWRQTVKYKEILFLRTFIKNFPYFDTDMAFHHCEFSDGLLIEIFVKIKLRNSSNHGFLFSDVFFGVGVNVLKWKIRFKISHAKYHNLLTFKHFVANLTMERFNVFVITGNMFLQRVSPVKCFWTYMADEISFVKMALKIKGKIKEIKFNTTKCAKLYL